MLDVAADARSNAYFAIRHKTEGGKVSFNVFVRFNGELHAL
jgi:hypothetical protein